MKNYKGIAVHDELIPLIAHMDSVQEYREMLQSLQAVWDNLTLLGQLSGTGTDMSDTRQAFAGLTAALLNNLGIETRKKVALEMESKAQVAIDIMVRNLFERTADIGFLATDHEIRNFLEFVSENNSIIHFRDEIRQRRDRLVARFEEYARKYTVYSNIILLDTNGKLMAQLDQGNPLTESSDSLIAASLTTGAAYVETFRQSDLLPNQAAASLIYSYRVTSSEGVRPLGVLCLCFRLENETARIFENLTSQDDWCALSLISPAGHVVASSDAYHVPVGARLFAADSGHCCITRFAGREYLAVTRDTKGYQGYMGPGWRGHAILPLEKAFTRADDHRLDKVPPILLSGVMMSPSLFSEDLRSIPLQAGKIQRELNRSVWNGNVRQSSDKRAINPAFSKVLLWEISNTGLRTRDIFASSIGNLHETVVSSILEDCEFRASLAIDIMDRNLYERSDDCRWWALTTVFRETLAATPSFAEMMPAARDQITRLLRTINGLYTVYTNLLVFDTNGTVMSVSNPSEEARVGRPISEEWVRRTLLLKDSQSYAVSAFDPTTLYGGAHTYIYAAAIRHPEDMDKVVGGIGIVFDSTPQFEAMLLDSLPRDEHGSIPDGCFGVLADRNRKVIASSDSRVPIGEIFKIDPAFFEMKNGQTHANIVEYEGQYYAVGSKISSGYREFKSSDDAYRNDVAALCLVPLGVIQEDIVTHSREQQVQMPHLVHSKRAQESTEIATFYIGDEWFGIPSINVAEAIDIPAITPIPGMPSYVRGVVMFKANPILVFDLKDHLKFGKPVDSTRYAQIVVVKQGSDDHFGILVHQLGEIPEVENQYIESVANLFHGEGVLSESVVRPDPTVGRAGILVVLSAERIRAKLIKAKERAMAPLLEVVQKAGQLAR